MARFSSRILSTATVITSAAEAPPPEAIALESDFVVILAALLCALICVVGLVATARCAWRRRSTTTTTTTRSSAQPSSSLANKGLKKKILHSFPKFTFTATQSGISTNTECAICLAEFIEGDEIRVLPQCNHGFHVACIDKWLGSHSSCPSCRQILVTARCQKCGQALSGAGGDEARLKGREDSNSNSYLP